VVLLALEEVALRFGGLAALAGITLDVHAGEILGLIGPNGAGKTTLFNVVTGLYRPTTGRVTFDGRDLTRLTPHEVARAGIARTFQNTEVFRALSALDNVLVGEHARLASTPFGEAAWLPHVARAEAMARARARRLLDLVGLGDVAGVEAGALPLGSQKRLELARALAASPRLLLLDEPAGGLDPQDRRALMALICRLRDDVGVTVMLVEHDMDLVTGISDRVAVLHYGRKIAEGTPRAVAVEPVVVEAYLGSDEPGA